MRSCSRRKQSGRHQPLRFSADVWLSRQSQTATQHRPTSRSGISPALGEIAANVISPIRGTATQHPPFGGAEHGVLGDAPAKPQQHAAYLYIETMEAVLKEDIPRCVDMMRQLQRISNTQNANPATSTEVAWQQRKCRRLLRYPTLDAVAPGER